MSPHLLATKIIFQAGGPNATPRSKSFKIGIPYIYALQFDIDISRDDAPEELQAANEYVEIDDLAARDQQRMLTRRR